MSNTECPVCGNDTVRVDVIVEGGHGDPIPDDAVDVCTLVITGPVPGVVLNWHDHVVDEVNNDE